MTDGDIHPNIVFSKGRHLYQRLISHEDAEDLPTTDRHRLDEQKTDIKLLKQDDSTRFRGVIYNDDQDYTGTLVFKVFEAKPSTYVTYAYTLDGVAIVDSDTFTLTPNQMKVLNVTVAHTNNTPTQGDLSFVIVQIYADGVDDVSDWQDVYKLVTVLPLIDEDDVELDYEELVEDEIIFPSTFTYDSATVIKAFIDKRTIDALEYIASRCNSVLIPDYEHLKTYLLARVKMDCYMKFVDMAISGGQEFIPLIRELDMQARQALKVLEAPIENDY
jgi:hypothetical protein